ncbi:MAG: hypothetical protein ACC651_10080, partial [Candidatus Scalindua sp.]
GVNFNEEEKSAYEAEESVENLFDVIESITNSAIKVSESNSGGRVAEINDPELACATVDFTGTRQSGRVEINFGDGCEGPDGKIRKGIIVVEYDGHWLVNDSKIYTVLKNFYVDDVKIEGTRILTNVSVDLEALVYTVEIINGKVIWPDETFLTRESDRTHTWIFGNGLDDFELHVEGEALGKTRLGVEYTSKTIEPLIFKSSCRGNTIYLPVSGVKTITIPERPVITVNYGLGDCDNKFEISIGEGSKEVTV